MSQAADRVDAAVSYSRADQARVEKLLHGLRARGLTIWFDKDIPGGALWEEIIARKYRASGALLFFVSRASLASQRCSEEVSTARTLGKPIIPVLLEPMKLPDELPDRFVLTLQARNVVEVHDRPAEEADAAILKALEGFGIAPGVAPPPQTATVRAVDQPRREDRRRRGGAWIAFGGLALALLLVLGAYFFFVGSGDRVTSDVSGAGPPAATRPTSTPAPGSRTPDDKPPIPPIPPAEPPANALGQAADAVIEMAAPSFAEGEPIHLTVKGLPGNDQDFVALANAGAKPSEYFAYAYGSKRKEAELKYRPILNAGRYEARAYFADSTNTVRGVASFEVVPARPVTLTLDKPAYVEGDPIVASVTGLPGNERDTVVLARAGDQEGAALAYEYANGASEAELKFKPIMKAGRYEMRVFFDDRMEKGQIRASVAFEVTPLAPPTVATSAPEFALGRIVTGRYANMAGNKDDWVAISRADQPDFEYLDYVYTKGERAGDFAMHSPMAEGDYELRAFFADSSGDKTVRARQAFRIVAPVTPVLALDADNFAPGDEIRVSFSGMPENEKDWLSIAAAGTSFDAFLSYRYTGGADEGVLALQAPDKPGKYEVRAYFDDTMSDRIVRASVSFIVAEAGGPPTPETPPVPAGATPEAQPEPPVDPAPPSDPTPDEQPEPEAPPAAPPPP